MTNDCILSTRKGCAALKKQDEHCGTNGCPFFKTERQECNSQAYAKRRCERLGIAFKACYLKK